MARRLPRAIVFDLDGTLVDTLRDILSALNRVMDEEALRAITYDQGRVMVGGGARWLVEQALREAGGATGTARIDACHTRFLDYYLAESAASSRPFDGVTDMLTRLGAAGHLFGVCTNKPHEITLRVLDALDLSGFFGAAVLGGDVLGVRKPDADHLLAVLGQMGAAPDRALMVGDSETDVAVARNAGVPVAVVDFGYTARPATELGADAVISSFDELPGLLDRLG